MLNGIKQFVVVILFGLISFFPNYGIIWLIMPFIPSYPIPTFLFLAIWTIIFLLLLPLTLRIFQHLSSVCLFVIFGITGFICFQHGILSNTTVLWSFIIVDIFALIGWYIVSVPMWRKIHTVLAVQQTGEEHHSN